MKYIFLLLTLLFCLPLGAQMSEFQRKEALMPLVERLTAFGKKIPQEKVYVHMDNTCYFQGDTIWFLASPYSPLTASETCSSLSKGKPTSRTRGSSILTSIAINIFKRH